MLNLNLIWLLIGLTNLLATQAMEHTPRPTIILPTSAPTPTPPPSPVYHLAQQVSPSPAQTTVTRSINPSRTRIRPIIDPIAESYTKAQLATAEAQHMTTKMLNLVEQRLDQRCQSEEKLFALHFLLTRIANDNLAQIIERSHQAALLQAMSNRVNNDLKKIDNSIKPVLEGDQPSTPIGLTEILTAAHRGFNSHK